MAGQTLPSTEKSESQAEICLTAHAASLMILGLRSGTLALFEEAGTVEILEGTFTPVAWTARVGLPAQQETP
jgi:hypothetical protein